MSLLDIFKKKKKIKEAKREKKPSEALIKKKEEEIKIEPPKPKKKIIGAGYDILASPHITEKATELANKNKYVFKVLPKASKVEIKKAVEGSYGVEVVGVNIINAPSKKRRLGRFSGQKKGYKKAIVKIKEGQKIEILPR